jgi:hypothetical protein
VQLRRFFFQPLELHLELADFLEELRLALGRFGHAWRCLRREDFRQSLQHVLFPLAHLHRVDLVSGGYRVHRLHSFERFQPYLGFELGTELTSTFLGHGLDRFSGLGLTIPPVQFSGATSILMESVISYSTTGSTTGSTATLNVGRIRNYRASGTVSGTLALQLWATASEYISGTLYGYKLVELPIGTSSGGYFYDNISGSRTLTAPPNGNYNMVMVLAEWNGSAYVTIDWGNFSNRTSFGINEIAPVIVTQPSSRTITSGGSVSFNASASGTPAPTYQWKKDGSLLVGATSSTYTISSTATSDAGSYTVVVTNSAGSATSNAAFLTVTTAATAPTITTQPSSSSVAAGSAASFSVVAGGTAPLSYQWRKDGVAISGATSSTYSISSTATSDAGSYTVVVTNSAGSATSSTAALTVTASATAPRLFNLSVRAALDANQIAIVGFTMSGGAKNVLLRAAGPTLSVFEVPGVMADPKLDLYRESTKVSTNDNWGGQTTLSTAFASVGAFPYSSTTSLDAALVSSIDGGQTVHVYGPTAGTVLIEAYDAGTGDSQRFTNLSARNKVGVGANILIAGFTLEGSGTRNLLIRAVGPKLTDFNVSGVLADPKLEIYSGTTKLYENDNWLSSLSTTFASVGAFALNTGSKDAAITVALPAGGYTVHVSGADGGIGEAIVEIYELP